jgi:hypothetical protein
MVYGAREVMTIEHEGAIHPENGKREPSMYNDVMFGMAHRVETLRNATTTFTDGKTLAEYLS